MRESSLIGTQRDVLFGLRHWAKIVFVQLRVRQWVKNLLVLAPLVFSRSLFAPNAVASALAAFTLFCLMSSSVYLLNDIQDYERDRLHPDKRRRPIAAGEIGLNQALTAAVLLLVFTLGGAWLLSEQFTLILLAYWLINMAYSTWLKHQVILDVFSIAAGFVLRIFGGGVAIHVEVSHWLLLCTTLLALFLGFTKRRHELLILGDDAHSHRIVLAEYNPHFLDMIIAIVTSATLMCYALYTVSEDTVRRFNTEGLLLTIPFVLYGIFRYLYLTYHKNLGGDPTETLLKDLPTLVNLLLWGLVAAVIVYAYAA